VRKISSPPVFDRRTIQAVGSCYTDYATPVHVPEYEDHTATHFEEITYDVTAWMCVAENRI
jgi:hypothetical protein